MEEQLISFETAKLAKEKGFDYQYSWIPGIDNSPSQSVLQRWLREKYNVQVLLNYKGVESDSMEWSYTILYLPIEHKNAKRWVKHVVEIESGQFHINNTYSGFFDRYEEALEVGLLEALKLIL